MSDTDFDQVGVARRKLDMELLRELHSHAVMLSALYPERAALVRQAASAIGRLMQERDHYKAIAEAGANYMRSQ